MVSAIGSPQYLPFEAPPAPAGGTPADPATAGSAAPARTTALAVNAHSEANGSLSITTREGDTVTLSAHMDADVTYASLRTRGGSGSVSARYASLEFNSSFSIEIQGDLSEQEMADIQKLVKQFSHELRDFFRGDTGAQGRQGASLDGGNLASLSGYAAHFDASRSVTVVAAVSQSSPVSPGVLAGPVTPVADSAGEPDGSTVASSADGFASSRGRDLSELVRRLVQATRDSGLSAPHANRAVNAFFREAAQLFGGHGERQALGHAEQAVKHAIQSLPAEAAFAPDETEFGGPGAESHGRMSSPAA